MKIKTSFLATLFIALAGCGAKPLGSRKAEEGKSAPAQSIAAANPSDVFLSDLRLMAIPTSPKNQDAFGDESEEPPSTREVTDLFAPVYQRDQLLFQKKVRTHFFNRKRNAFDPVFLAVDAKKLGPSVQKILYSHSLEEPDPSKVAEHHWSEFSFNEDSQRWQLPLQQFYVPEYEAVHDFSIELKFSNESSKRFHVSFRLERLLPGVSYIREAADHRTPEQMLNAIAQGEWAIEKGVLSNPSPFPLKVWFYADERTRLHSYGHLIYNHFKSDPTGLPVGPYQSRFVMGAAVDSRQIRIKNLKTGEAKSLELRRGQQISWMIAPHEEVMIEWFIAPLEEGRFCSMPGPEQHNYRGQIHSLASITLSTTRQHDWSFIGSSLEGSWFGSMGVSAPSISEKDLLQEDFMGDQPSFRALFEEISDPRPGFFVKKGNAVKAEKIQRTSCQGHLVFK